MNKIAIIFVLFFYASVVSRSQNKDVYGYVYDRNTGEKLIGATVISKQTNNGCITDNNGYFHLSISDTAACEYQISFIGYKPENKLIKPENKQIHIYLIPQTRDLSEVTVVGNVRRKYNIGNLNLSVDKIKQIPMIGGETDILRAFQLLPGVQGGDEGASNLLVRGGSQDQNIFLMDNIPLYYVNHIGGFTSVFDADAINDVSIYKGGFPAQYGGRLSSIMDIDLKNGNKYETKKSLTIGVISSKFFIEGPAKNSKTTYLLSMRVCNAGLLLQAANKMNKDGYSNGYNFYDLTSKITHNIDKRNDLYFSFYAGLDNLSSKIKPQNNNRIKSSGKDSYKWGNIMTSLRWYHQYKPNIVSNTTIAYSRFFNNSVSKHKSELKEEEVNTKITYKSLINDLILKNEYKFYFKNDQKLKLGADITIHNFSPFSSGYKNTSSTQKQDTMVSAQIYSYSGDLYLAGDFVAFDKFFIQPGIRISSWLSKDCSYINPEPRIIVAYKPNDKINFSASYSYMTQYAHLLTNMSNTIPNDLWVPSTKKLVPEKSNQYGIGFLLNLPFHCSLNIEAFYKSMNNLIEYEESAYSFRQINWQDGITSGGKGISKGIEFLLKKETGKFDGWISYTISKSTRRFDNINNGKEYPFKFDHRHDLNILCNYHLNENLSISAVWTYNGGNNITMPMEKYHIYNSEPYPYKAEDSSDPYHLTFIENPDLTIYNYNNKNGYKTPPYHRLDIGVNYKKNEHSFWYFGIYNVYNRHNAYYYYIKDGQWKKFSMFPIIPSISYTYKF